MLLIILLIFTQFYTTLAQTCQYYDASDPKVCSGHGKCVADQCECDENYEGIKCQYTSCFGEGAGMQTFICSGHGACLSYNNCSCEIGWYGEQCENYKHVYNPFQGYNLISYETSLPESFVFPGYSSDLYTYNGNWPHTPQYSLKGAYENSVKANVMYLTFYNFYSEIANEGVPPHWKRIICDQDFTFNGGERYIYFYYQEACNFNGVTWTFNGTDRIHIDISSLVAVNIKFKFLNCASYNNIYWSIGGADIEGDFYGNVQFKGRMNARDTTFYGTVILTSAQIYSLDSDHPIHFGNFSVWDPYQSYLSPSCPKPAPTCFGKMAKYKGVCGKHGKCIANDQCLCNFGFSGKECTTKDFTCGWIDPDHPDVCSGVGRCVSQDWCQCNDGTEGNDCPLTCFGSETPQCSGNGACISYNNCSCNIGWSGEKCDQFKHFENPFQGYNIISDSEPVIQTWIEDPIYLVYYPDIYSLYEVPTKNSNPLSKEKTRMFINTAITFYDQFVHTNLIDLTCEQNMVFKGGLTYSTTSRCTFDSVTLTFDGADIIYMEFTYLKVKNVNFVFTNCASYNNIYWKVLNGEAHLEETDFYGNLFISGGWFDIGNSRVFGSIIAHNLNFRIYENVKFGNFSSLDPYQSYLSPSCHKTIGSCYGIQNTSTSICSGHGTCISEDQCVCNPGYMGAFCQIKLPTCYGLRSDQNGVCSNHGTCVATDTCICQNGYYEVNCRTTTVPSCGGIPATDPNVCNGHGRCVSDSNCVCNSPYLANDNCKYSTSYNCYGVDRLDPKVCSGHGRCVDTDQCVCSTNYSGTKCQITQCFGVSNTNTNAVCNGNGVCGSFNTCTCKIGWTSSFCNQTKKYYNPFQGYNMIIANSRVATKDFFSLPGKLAYGKDPLTGTEFSSPISAAIEQNEADPYGNMMVQMSDSIFSGLSNRKAKTSLLCSSSPLYIQGGNNYEIDETVCVVQSKTIIIDGYEDIYIKANYLFLRRDVTFEFRNCSSYNNIYWDVSYLDLSGDTSIYGNIRAKSVTVSNAKIYGTLFLPDMDGSYAYVLFGTSQFMNFTNWDPYLQFVDSNCISPSVIVSNNVSTNSTNNSTSVSNSSISSNSTGIVSNNNALVNSTQNSNSSLVNNTIVYNNNNTGSNSSLINNITMNNSSAVNVTNGNYSMVNSSLGGNNSVSNGSVNNSSQSVSNFTISNSTNNGNNSVSNSTNMEINNSTLNSNITQELNSTFNSTSNSSLLINETISQNNTNIVNEKIIESNQTLNNSQILNETTSNNGTLESNKNSSQIIVSNNSSSSIVNESISNNQTFNDTQISNDTINSNSSINNNTFINQSNITQDDNSTLSNNQRIDNQTIHEENNQTNVLNQTNDATNSSNVSNGTESAMNNNTIIIGNNTVVSNLSSNSESNLNVTNTDKNSTIVTNNSTIILSNITLTNQTIVNSSTNSTLNQTVNQEFQNSTINCDRIVNCSNHGDCNSQGQCICSSNDEEGYWSGSNCQICAKDFYGKSCNTKIVGPALISPDFKGVTFILHAPQMVNDSISCDKIVNPLDLAIFGSKQSNVKCQYTDRKNDIFMISFGSLDFDFTPGTTTIQINTQAFENLMLRSTPKYITLVILIPETVDFSQAIISMPNINQYSSCDTISADGSSSYSFDGRSLTFYWFLLDSNMNILFETFPNQPALTLDSSIPPNSYRIGLKVKSNFLNSNSSLEVSSIFNKATAPLPMLTMYKGKTIIEKYSNEFPITLKKIVQDSSCKSSTDTIQIEWSQISGPIISTTVDAFNNLFIPKLTVFGNYTYVFRVSVFYNSNRKVSLDVNLRTKSPELQLNILQVETLSELTSLQIDFVDPEAIFNGGSSEVWKWTSDNQSPALLSTLNSLSNSKSAKFSLSAELLESKVDTVVLTLEITKGDGRSIQKSTIIHFFNIPPLVNIVSIEPATPIILPGQLITIQTLTVSNSSNSTWVLNGKVIDPSSIIQQSASGSETNTISIDSSSLDQGSVNSLSIFTYDTKTGLSTQTSYTFQVASTPRVCSCDVTPKEGTALSTDFLFYCENCKTTDNNIDYRYGFIDDRSEAKIVMYNLGEVYSTKLPAPFTGTSVTCFFDIVDKTTGAFSTTFTNVTIYKPLVQNVAEIQNIVQQWEDQSTKYTIDGDFSKSVYQSASTSRTDSVFLKEAFSSYTTTSRRSDSIVCQNGVDVSGECKCKDGWFGVHCELSITDFSNIQGTKLSILQDMMFVVNSTAGMNNNYLSLLSFAIDSLLVNYPYLDTNTISESLSTLNSFLNYALSDQNVKISGGVDVLLSNCMEFAFKYITERQYVIDQTSNSDSLHTALKKSSSLQARSSSIGSAGKSKKGPFFSAVLNRNTIYDFPNSIYDSISKTRVIFEAKFFIGTTESISLVKRSFVSVLTVTGDIFSLNSRLQASQKTGNKATFSKLISPIVSVDFSELPVQVDGSKITYIIPYNITNEPEGIVLTNLEFADKVKTVSCGSFRSGSPTTIRTDCTLKSRNSTHLVCTCVRFTNVFGMETTVVSYHSYIYVEAIVVSIVAAFFFLLLIVAVIFTVIKLRKNRQERIIVDDSHSSFSLRVQQVEMESLHSQSPRDMFDSPPIPQEKTRSMPVQSIYHSKRKLSQIVPLRVDLMDEKYCDNLSSNGSDCEYSQ